MIVPAEISERAEFFVERVQGLVCRAEILAADVHFGSKADIEARPPDVRFTPKSRHSALQLRLSLFDQAGAGLFHQLCASVTSA